MLLLGWVIWLSSFLVGFWFLRTFREIHHELRTIRRYLQSLHDHLEHR